MREITFLKNWLFTKDNQDAPASSWESVIVPHTWNNFDGQDGGDNYYRGKCFYKIKLPKIENNKKAFCEFEAANHICEVFINGNKLMCHEGGFSAFRAEVTSYLQQGEAELLVSVFNGKSHVYPQMADFTFFGGLYRPVKLIITDEVHFDLMRLGSNGVFITPKAKGEGADIRIDAFAVNGEGATIKTDIINAEGEIVASGIENAENNVINIEMQKAVRWHGVENPYLYTAKTSLLKNGEVCDEVISEFGIREYMVDADKGFILNGKPYHLHGVSRHQDKLNKGWALDTADHARDIELILEVGATTIRLAHYQHSQDFYTMCDRAGLVLWAEIPFISSFMPQKESVENTLSQMTELIVQNYNHAAICFWGISNEITIAGADNPELLENLKQLNTLAKKLDPSRLTTIANVTMLAMESQHNQITDVLSYNHYFGWYMGDVSQNGPWLDEFHKKYPTRPIGVSEYGAEAILKWHSATPKVRDYSEEYQALYHEEMLKTFEARPYIWATHVWNMFDFAADARDEGGCEGRNNKGLATFDREICKDSFYIYKAYWAKEPFVHITGKRFVQRADGEKNIKVYSNCSEVVLKVNDESFTLKGNKSFVFENMPIKLGSNTVTASAVTAKDDTAVFVGVTQPNEEYHLPPEPEIPGLENVQGVENWFSTMSAQGTELKFPEGYHSIRSTIGELVACPEAMQVLINMFTSMMGKEMMNGGMIKTMIKMMSKKPLEDVLKMAGDKLPINLKIAINEELNKIKK